MFDPKVAIKEKQKNWRLYRFTYMKSCAHLDPAISYFSLSLFCLFVWPIIIVCYYQSNYCSQNLKCDGWIQIFSGAMNHFPGFVCILDIYVAYEYTFENQFFIPGFLVLLACFSFLLSLICILLYVTCLGIVP